MSSELPRVSRAKINYLIDHCWMVENPDRNEHAFLFRLIQERHRRQFEQTLEHVEPPQTDAGLPELQTIEAERDRAEEILYWLYWDSELRKRGTTLPDEWERGRST